MKPETVEWVAKADSDLDTAKREVAVVEAPNYDAVCFHAPRERRVDSVTRHREWQKHLDKKLFFDDVFGG